MESDKSSSRVSQADTISSTEEDLTDDSERSPTSSPHISRDHGTAPRAVSPPRTKPRTLPEGNRPLDPDQPLTRSRSRSLRAATQIAEAPNQSTPADSSDPARDAKAYSKSIRTGTRESARTAETSILNSPAGPSTATQPAGAPITNTPAGTRNRLLEGGTDGGWKMEDLKILETVGQSASGPVCLVQHKTTHSKVLMKAVHRHLVVVPDFVAHLNSTVQRHVRFPHPNIVKLRGFFLNPHYIFLLVEYVPRGTLLKELRGRGRLPESEVARYVRQIGRTVLFCRMNDATYYDIKPENIFIGSDEQPQIYDFIRSVRGQTASGDALRQANYTPPEALQGFATDWRADAWRIGVLVFEMLTGVPPFHRDTENETKTNVMKDSYTCPDFLAFAAKEFIDELLQRDPNDRLTVEEMLRHRWVIQGPPHENPSS